MTDLKLNMENKRYVIKRSGELEEIDINKINKRIIELSKDLKNIDSFSIVQSLISTIHDKITTSQLDLQAANLSVQKNTIHYEYDILGKETNHQYSCNCCNSSFISGCFSL